jgi:hypothetical protein
MNRNKWCHCYGNRKYYSVEKQLNTGRNIYVNYNGSGTQIGTYGVIRMVYRTQARTGGVTKTVTEHK